MAYFSNGCEGEVFDEQCARCRWGEQFCPIHYVMSTYNYKACNVPVAREILDYLIKQDGTCVMYEVFKKILGTEPCCPKCAEHTELQFICESCGTRMPV